MPDKTPKLALKSLLMAMVTMGISACSSHPNWILQPPMTTVSACAPAGEQGWQLAELRAKAQLAEQQWLSQLQWSDRSQLTEANEHNWQHIKHKRMQQERIGVVPTVQNLAHWQGRIGDTDVQCVLLKPSAN